MNINKISNNSPLARGVAGGTRRGVAKKFIFAIMCVVSIATAYAENEPAATSKEYVDAELATKQPTIPAEGANVVMTFDSNATDGIGTKNIYDPSGSYATQQNALVTAATANAAVQMAINGEFVCHEWNPDDSTDCWLWDIKQPVAPSRNLFDVSKVPTINRIVNNGDGSIRVTANGTSTGKTLLQLAPDLVAGQTYTLCFKTTSVRDFIAILYDSHQYIWRNNTSKTITSNMLKGKVFFYSYDSQETATISNIQIEEGTVATPYQPYGQNTFLPQTN